MIKKIFFLLFIFCSSCSTSVDSNHQEGKHSITCRNHTSDCYDKASSLCPDGYLVTNRVRPVKSGSDTVFTLNVKCRGKIFY